LLVTVVVIDLLKAASIIPATRFAPEVCQQQHVVTTGLDPRGIACEV